MTSEITYNDHRLTRLEYRRDWSTASVLPHAAVPFVGSQDTVSAVLAKL